MVDSGAEVNSTMVISSIGLALGCALLLWLAFVALQHLILTFAWIWLAVLALSVPSKRGLAAAAWGFGISGAVWGAIMGGLSVDAALMAHMPGPPILGLGIGLVFPGLLLALLKPLRKYQVVKLAGYGFNLYPWTGDDVSSSQGRDHISGGALHTPKTGK